MKKALWIMTIVFLFLLNTSSISKNEKNIWDDYELVRLDEIKQREKPYQIEYHKEAVILEEAERIFIEPTYEKEGFSWMAEKVKEGNHTQLILIHQYVYNADGVLLSKTIVPDSMRYYESSQMIYEYGSKPKVGTIFAINRITKYGADCGGCYPDASGNASTASGALVGLTSVRQSNGEWKNGITYDGYYIMATSRNVPMCSILEITGHSFSGMGLEPNVPFQAIVLDRGVNDGILDLFVGSEYRLEIVRQTQRSNDYMAEIVAMGTLSRNSQGQRICKIEEGPH